MVILSLWIIVNDFSTASRKEKFLDFFKQLSNNVKSKSISQSY